MRLRSLRKLEEIKIKEEHDLLKKENLILAKLVKSDELQWKEISKEIKEIKKNYSKKTEIGKRRTSINNELVIKDVDYEFSSPAEPITVVLSQHGWIKTLKGIDHDLNEIKFKDDDGLLLFLETNSNSKLLFFASNGKFYTINPDQLPSGRGFGDPLKLLIDLEDGEEIISIHSYKEEDYIILGSKYGNGFAVSQKDALSNRKSGKQILNLSEGDKAVSSDNLKGNHIVVIGENKKMLIFSLEEIPKMAKGKGVKLQRYKEGYLKKIISFNIREGLNVVDLNGRNRFFEEIENWKGKRGQAGKKVPKGFPRNF